jgi:hypothetical protein
VGTVTVTIIWTTTHKAVKPTDLKH